MSNGARRPSFGTRLGNMLAMSALDPLEARRYDDPIMEDVDEEAAQQEGQGGLTGAKVGDDRYAHNGRKSIRPETRHEFKAWQIEAASVDRSVQILPGVKKVMDSIPRGHYAVATSGAKTYGMQPSSILYGLALTSSS
jgi:hypothetical protein